ncbi:hypothetical protein CRYUN_Cryun20dG0086300 [Craigia yunnanensis]
MDSSNSGNASLINVSNNGATSLASSSSSTSSRYENQKRRDWNTFGQYLKNHRPPLSLSRCSGAHVLEFLRYLDQFGKTKVHIPICPFYATQTHQPLAHAHSAKPGVASMLSSAASELPLKKMEENLKQTHLGHEL